VSRPPREGFVPHIRERLKLESVRAAPLRELYPQLAELRIEFEFEDGTTRVPSPQSFAYFPAARGFFRYACPCHACSGEFDLSSHVAELVGAGRRPRSRRVELTCTGQRAQEVNVREACPMCARIRVSAILHPTESSA
jgi:hypothetical protein